jgi:hypothetical protein
VICKAQSGSGDRIKFLAVLINPAIMIEDTERKAIGVYELVGRTSLGSSAVYPGSECTQAGRMEIDTANRGA